MNPNSDFYLNKRHQPLQFDSDFKISITCSFYTTFHIKFLLLISFWIYLWPRLTKNLVKSEKSTVPNNFNNVNFFTFTKVSITD